MKKIENVFITDTIYSLFFYLLVTPDEKLERTFYFTSTGIAESVYNRLKHKRFIPKTPSYKQFKIYQYFSLRLLSLFKWPFLNRANIFALDHLPYSPFIIGYRNYTCIEDGPNIFTAYKKSGDYDEDRRIQSRSCTFKEKILSILLGPVYGGRIGTNRLCKMVMMSTDDYDDKREGKLFNHVDLKDLWNSASEYKKNYIFDVFDLKKEDFEIAKSKSVVLITQQFSSDHVISEEEQINIYKTLLAQENIKDVLIKPHPRDHVDYRSYFPDALVLDKPIPFQTLTIMGVKFKKAITVYSSSVSSFDYDLDIEISGTSINPKLVERYGLITREDVIRK